MALKIKLPNKYLEFPVNESKKIPKSAGLYYFYNQHWQLLYVGKSKDLRNRVNAHLSGKTNTKIFHLEIAHIRIYIVNDAAEREIYETYIINDLKPMYNISKAYYEPIDIKNHKFNLGKFDDLMENEDGLTERDIEYRLLYDKVSAEINYQYWYNQEHKTGKRVPWSKLKQLKKLYPKEEAKYMRDILEDLSVKKDVEKQKLQFNERRN